jgi:cation diffusion facilitator family transporter
LTRIAASNIAVSMAVLGLKAAAWWLSGSAALFSDALESIVNVATAVMAFAALSLAAKPADDNHPFGHHKIEFFAAVAEGGLIIAASVTILQHAWVVWLHPGPVREPAHAIAVSLFATLVNAVWGGILWRTGRQVRSPALKADARHLFGDVFTSIVLAIGVALVAWTGITRLDPALAAAAAIAVLCSGYVVVRDSIGGLMDEAPGPEIVEKIRCLVEQYAEGALEVHDLRTRHAGSMTFLEFHLVVPGAMTVAAAHIICDRIEEGLRSEMQGVRTTIHVEPEGKAKHLGVLAL